MTWGLWGARCLQPFQGWSTFGGSSGDGAALATGYFLSALQAEAARSGVPASCSCFVLRAPAPAPARTHPKQGIGGIAPLADSVGRRSAPDGLRRAAFMNRNKGTLYFSRDRGTKWGHLPVSFIASEILM